MNLEIAESVLEKEILCLYQVTEGGEGVPRPGGPAVGLRGVRDEAAAGIEAAGIVRDYEVAVWHIVARRPVPPAAHVAEPPPKPSLTRRLRGKLGRMLRGAN